MTCGHHVYRGGEFKTRKENGNANLTETRAPKNVIDSTQLRGEKAIRNGKEEVGEPTKRKTTIGIPSESFARPMESYFLLHGLWKGANTSEKENRKMLGRGIKSGGGGGLESQYFSQRGFRQAQKFTTQRGRTSNPNLVKEKKNV